ncbi:MAG: sigma-54-dependent Fis family transcriptional regulator [Deltaproteobacteria bacterium]|nr:sigma-54-dependent Fis family transcriptional regulator [Deltaproteobacteria bacterium]
MAGVLLVDDRPEILASYRYTIERDGHRMLEASCVAGARSILEATADIDVIVLDMSIPLDDGGQDSPEIGVAFLKELTTRYRKPVIVLTGMGADASRIDALAAGAYDYVGKGEDRKTLLARIRNAANEEARELEGTCLKVGIFPGQSSVFQSFIKTLRLYATRSEKHVLILGESGSGKELAARAIHKLGSHSRGPFEALNCGAIPETLVENELFGHERGAFSGADRRWRGAFDRAAKGTIFLDEVAELPGGVQSKLLRVLSGYGCLPLGGGSLLPMEARVLAATNRDLARMIEEGGFRSELFGRLGQLVIRVPNLRERREDIFPLAQHLVERSNWSRHYSHWKELLEECRSVISEYDWPGNVLQLGTFIERLFVVTEERSVNADAAGKILREMVRERSPASNQSPERLSFVDGTGKLRPFDQLKDDLILGEPLCDYIRRAYQLAGGRWQLAASLMEINDDTLRKYRRMLEERGFVISAAPNRS